MKTINIDCSHPYSIIIGNGTVDQLSDNIGTFGRIDNILIISDSIVAGIYLEKVKSTIQSLPCTIHSYILAAGETSKSLDEYTKILNFLIGKNFGRNDLILALGGGVVSDLSGFVASTYMRGIRYLTIPTTLLSAVDASVGGKTAINMPGGKNLVGSFYHPSLVICDISLFKTLPDSTVRDGLAEVLKYSFICKDLNPDSIAPPYDYESIVNQCVMIKSKFVSSDEYDRGVREALNFGHTIGHGYEVLSKYKISHGMAVAMGMIIEICIGI